jgi:uncharacterized membrane protein YfcA
MLSGISAGEIAVLASAILVGGIVTGILSGLFGIGGGAVIVPVLYEVFRTLAVPEDVRMQLCVGTSLAIIVPTSIRSYLTHRAKGYVIKDVIRAWAIPAIAGVGTGSVIAAFAPPAVFKLAFVVIASMIAFRLLFAREHWRLGADLPGPVTMTGFGFLIGLASSLMGVGAGGISNAVLTLYGKPLHNAVAVSSGLGVPVTIAGALGYMVAGWRHQALLPPLSIGFVSLIGFALMAPVSSYVAPIGARLAHRMSKRRLEVAFGIFLLAISARFLAGLIF